MALCVGKCSIRISCHQNFNMKSTDLILDVNQRTFEAALFINDWVYDLNLGKHLSVGTCRSW